ncbi:MAG: DMT family transporter [Syntrophomonas sp.]
MRKSYQGIILVLISACSFAMMPIFAVYAYQGKANVTTVLFLRFGLAALIFFIYMAIKTDKIIISRSHLRSLLFIGGILYTLQASLYFESVKYIPTSLQALLFYVYPIFVAILSSVVDRERPTKNLIVSIFISLIGLSLVLGTSFKMLNSSGTLLAIGAAAVYAVYIIISSRITRDGSPVVNSAFITLSAAFAFLVMGLSSNSLSFSFNKAAWLPILGIVLFSTVISIFTLLRGLALLGSTKSAILSMVEPLATILFSSILFHDSLSHLQWLGGVMVLSGAAMVVSAKEKHGGSSTDI